jgi:hypothetical protein
MRQRGWWNHQHTNHYHVNDDDDDDDDDDWKWRCDAYADTNRHGDELQEVSPRFVVTTQKTLRPESTYVTGYPY